MDDRDLVDVLLPKLLRLEGEPVGPNALAAYVAGTLPAASREELSARIARDPEAMLLVRALEEDRRRAQSMRWRVVAWAASVLLGFGLWSLLAPGGQGQKEPIEVQVLAAARALGQRSPELFERFVPLSNDALHTRAPITRGGATWTAPVGLLLEAPTMLRWRRAAGSTRVALSVRGPGVEWSREVEGDRADAPVLGPGRYIVRLEALDALGAQQTRAVFEIADEVQRAELQRAEALIRDTVDAALADLLVAHYATWAGFHGRARQAAESAAGAGGEIAKAATMLLQHLDITAPR